MASFIDTEKKKRSNYRMPQSIESLRRVNNYVSRDDKVGSVKIEKANNLTNKHDEEVTEEITIENLINKRNDAIFKYVTQDKKTEAKLISGINCSPSSVFDEMMLTKRIFNKMSGRQFKHFVHSYSNNETDLTPEMAHEITLKLLEHKKFKDFQILVTTHTDTKHVHSHIVINSVNMQTGKKWQHSTKDMLDIVNFSDRLCCNYGLKYSFANTNMDKFIRKENLSTGEYRAREKGRSWKYEAFLAIKNCKETAISKEDFINKLETLGYKVRWEDSRKNITFTFPNGRKCNNDKFHPPDIFTKEALEKRFNLNNQYQSMRKEFDLKLKFQAKQELVLQTIKILEDNPDLGHKDYPRSYLKNLESSQDIKEKMIEKAKGEGLKWGRER